MSDFNHGFSFPTYVMQFEDGTFLENGFFHGFIQVNYDEFGIGRTMDLSKARQFSADWEAQRVVYDMGIKEDYILKEIEIIYKLKGE